jgi:hypothetical protein
VLKQCEGNFTRENIMKQAVNLHDLELPTLLPGIRVTPARPTIIRSGNCSSENSTVPTGSP